MGDNSSPSRFWMVVAFFFISASLALVGFIIYVKVFEKPISRSIREAEVLNRYPLMFRTPEEQAIFEKQFYAENSAFNLETAEIATDTQLQNCSFSCPSRRRRSLATYHPLVEWINHYKGLHEMKKRDVTTQPGPNIYHGCCISRHYFVSPDFGSTISGTNYSLVQFDSRRQYFPSQICKHAENCRGCGCAQEINFFTAIVVNPNYPNDSYDPYTMVAIKLPGCCKCFNNLPAP
ncbi:uncharacterized protein LOC106069377 [Biomphalaria glabrata]|uniref:Uncharacterized protein LOC106069377 n=1 Tax=Biomphalaria glabrata TaxID=6526 RepID=A0A9W2Z3S6_BIOGL|nr:uncharacterized protein LOC106069377 [Biomphalaria glabrata]